MQLKSNGSDKSRIESAENSRQYKANRIIKKKFLNSRSINKTNVPFNFQLQIRLSNLRYLGHKIAGSSRIQLAMDTDYK